MPPPLPVRCGNPSPLSIPPFPHSTSVINHPIATLSLALTLIIFPSPKSFPHPSGKCFFKLTKFWLHSHHKLCYKLLGLQRLLWPFFFFLHPFFSHLLFHHTPSCILFPPTPPPTVSNPPPTPTPAHTHHDSTYS